MIYLDFLFSIKFYSKKTPHSLFDCISTLIQYNDLIAYSINLEKKQLYLIDVSVRMSDPNNIKNILKLKMGLIIILD